MVAAPRRGERMNGRASVTAARMGSWASRPNRVRTSPGCAQLAVTALPSSLRASSRVNKMFASAGMAGAALRKWALPLNNALAGTGVYAGHVAIGAGIVGTPGAPEGTPLKEPDDIARLYWDLHTSRQPAEHLISA